MKTYLHSQSGLRGWKKTRFAFMNPEKPKGEPAVIKVPETKIVMTAKELKEQQERMERLFKDYERKRKAMLNVAAQFKEKDDLDLRVKAAQVENRIKQETIDPAVLRSLRDVGEEDVQKYIDKLAEISNTELQKNEELAEWMVARDREKIDEAVERYNYMREVNIAMAENLGKYFFNKSIYASLLNDLQEGLPELKTGDVKTLKSVRVAILEIVKVMGKYKPYLDEARESRREIYEQAFKHAIGRAHDVDLLRGKKNLLKTNPAMFEKTALDMVSRITEVNMKELLAGDEWSITYKGLTFTVRPGGMGVNVRLVDADAENRAKYAKLAGFLDERKARAKTAMKGRKPEIEL